MYTLQITMVFFGFLLPFVALIPLILWDKIETKWWKRIMASFIFGLFSFLLLSPWSPCYNLEEATFVMTGELGVIVGFVMLWFVASMVEMSQSL